MNESMGQLLADAAVTAAVATNLYNNMHIAAEKRNSTMTKLTPRQNELISETLCQIASNAARSETVPELLKTVRRALIAELEAVTTETAPPSQFPLSTRSIYG